MGGSLWRLAGRALHRDSHVSAAAAPAHHSSASSTDVDKRELTVAEHVVTLPVRGKPSLKEPKATGMERILALTPTPSIILRPNLDIIEVSESYLASAALKRGECIGINIHNFISGRDTGPDSTSIQLGIERAIQSRAVYIIDGIRDASSAYWRSRIVPIFEEDELLYLILEDTETKEHVNYVPATGQSYTDETYRILVENVRDYAIFMLDTQGYVMTWNAGASILKGYKPDQILGKHFSIFYGNEDKTGHKPEKELEICLREGKVEDEGWRFRMDGTRFWASVTIAPVYRSGQHVGFSKVTRDLTERKAAETRLIAAFEEASKLKSDFLANISHEIR